MQDTYGFNFEFKMPTWKEMKEILKDLPSTKDLEEGQDFEVISSTLHTDQSINNKLHNYAKD